MYVREFSDHVPATVSVQAVAVRLMEGSSPSAGEAMHEATDPWASVYVSKRINAVIVRRLKTKTC
jgi:hypothetical protein